MLSPEFSYSIESITPFDVTDDDTCGLVGVALGALSRFYRISLFFHSSKLCNSLLGITNTTPIPLVLFFEYHNSTYANFLMLRIIQPVYLGPILYTKIHKLLIYGFVVLR